MRRLLYPCGRRKDGSTLGYTPALLWFAGVIEGQATTAVDQCGAVEVIFGPLFYVVWCICLACFMIFSLEEKATAHTKGA